MMFDMELAYVYFFKLLQTDTKKISAVSIFFETMPYRLDESTGYIDYDQVSNASVFELYRNIPLIFLETAIPNKRTYMEENSNSWREMWHCFDQNLLLRVQVPMPVSMTMREFARFLPLLGYR